MWAHARIHIHQRNTQFWNQKGIERSTAPKAFDPTFELWRDVTLPKTDHGVTILETTRTLGLPGSVVARSQESLTLSWMATPDCSARGCCWFAHRPKSNCVLRVQPELQPWVRNTPPIDTDKNFVRRFLSRSCQFFFVRETTKKKGDESKRNSQSRINASCPGRPPHSAPRPSSQASVHTPLPAPFGWRTEWYSPSMSTTPQALRSSMFSPVSPRTPSNNTRSPTPCSANMLTSFQEHMLSLNSSSHWSRGGHSGHTTMSVLRGNLSQT